MTRPRDALSGPHQYEVPSREATYERGIRAVQEIVRDQGQVMSATLDNNRALWETNKVLRRDVAELESVNKTLRRRLSEEEARANTLSTADVRAAALLKQQVAALREQLAEYERNGAPEQLSIVAALQRENESLRATCAQLRQELTASLYPEITAAQRQESLLRIRAQQAELLATGKVPSEDAINGEPEGTAAAAREANHALLEMATQRYHEMPERSLPDDRGEARGIVAASDTPGVPDEMPPARSLD